MPVFRDLFFQLCPLLALFPSCGPLRLRLWPLPPFMWFFTCGFLECPGGPEEITWLLCGTVQATSNCLYQSGRAWCGPYSKSFVLGLFFVFFFYPAYLAIPVWSYPRVWWWEWQKAPRIVVEKWRPRICCGDTMSVFLLSAGLTTQWEITGPGRPQKASVEKYNKSEGLGSQPLFVQNVTEHVSQCQRKKWAKKKKKATYKCIKAYHWQYYEL